MDSINLNLTVDEVNSVLQVLGELPTKSGAWNLLVKVKAQADAQVAASKETHE
jgi:hypothetical protein